MSRRYQKKRKGDFRAFPGLMLGKETEQQNGPARPTPAFRVGAPAKKPDQ
jgi:hypothetical protein